MLCDRNGKPTSSPTGLRKSSSRKCDCKWKGYTVLSETGWLYRNYSDNVPHNHEPSTQPSAHHSGTQSWWRPRLKRAIHTLGFILLTHPRRGPGFESIPELGQAATISPAGVQSPSRAVTAS
ncbi:uncharacterized protein B0H64DRAFT_82334 [Chaetomium fimeti]|uniref:FAR1 domain-containing protein n=1 Tax=Chaetomium fimeti TaxID=1854472 RepID=A0AAE0LV28_9PEZI|nr:hypothetical protein B0H64DRAFT_82334 [Chaetomium fimeti]